jgi:hypothetical protein
LQVQNGKLGCLLLWWAHQCKMPFGDEGYLHVINGDNEHFKKGKHLVFLYLDVELHH